MKPCFIFMVASLILIGDLDAFEFDFGLNKPSQVPSHIRSSYRKDHVNYLYQRNDRLADHYRSFMVKRDASYPLYANELAMIYLAQGNKKEAQTMFLEAYRVMNDVAAYEHQQKQAQSFFHSESVKVYKGDPYERMLNSFYLGLVYAQQEDWDNALACMKNALLADSFGEDEDNYSDFVPLYILASFIERKRNHPTKAQEQMDQAWKRYEKFIEPGSVYSDFTEMTPQLLVCSLGRGPIKYRVGAYGEELRFARSPRRWEEIEVIVDGVSVYRQHRDVGHSIFFQAVTRGKRYMDRLLKRKVTVKSGLLKAGDSVYQKARDEAAKGDQKDAFGLNILGTILKAASKVTNPSADARHWSLLPDEILICPLDLKKGPHQLKIVGHQLSGDSKVLLERHLSSVPESGLIVQEVRGA